MKSTTHLVLALRAMSSTAVVLLCLTGCAHTPKIKPLNLTIHPAGQAASLTIPVYVTGGNPTQEVMKNSVDDSLKTFAERPDPKVKTFHLSSTDIKLTSDDPLWKVWKANGADHIVVIADLPKNFGGAGPPDRRHIEVPLDKRRWNNLPKNTVTVNISEKAVWMSPEPGPVPQ